MEIQENLGPVSEEINSLDMIHLNTISNKNKIDFLSNLVESCRIACFSETHLDTNIKSNYLKLYLHTDGDRSHRRMCRNLN